MRLTDQFSLVAGLRDEHDRVRRWNITAGSPDARQFSKRLHNTTWRVGGVYQPLSTLSLCTQYSTGTDPLGTLTTYSGSQTALQNATGDQVEAGVKYSFLGGRGTTTLAAYRIVKKNLFVQQTLNSPIQQVGQRSSKGLEASLSVDLPQGFGIDVNGTVLDARFDAFVSGGNVYTGNTPPNIPEASANLWLRWDASAQFQARAGLRYVGRTFSDNDNSFRIPAYAVIDGTVTYALTRQVALDVRVYNLFDKGYAANAYYDDQWILGRPRSFDVVIRARF